MINFVQEIETALSTSIVNHQSLHGGSISRVYGVKLADRRQAAVKVADNPETDLSIEGAMLDYLRAHAPIPVPRVLYCTPSLLVMEYVDGDSRLGTMEQRHAAELVAALHSVTAPRFGFDQDTVIAQIRQPNPQTDRWVDFFRDQRLMYMAHLAYESGELSASVLSRIEKLATRLDSLLTEPVAPALLHGDLWTTNILARGGQIVGFIDPAIYYGHPEIELAFSTLFGTFSTPFFKEYHTLNPIEPGFFEERRDLYNLYPLLVHVRLFGGGYVGSVNNILNKFGV